MNQWFRFYNEVVNDPKVQRLKPEMFKAWVNLLCLASANDGVLPSIEDIAFALRINWKQATRYEEALIDAGLFDRSGDVVTVHSWERRQFKSDTSRGRTAKWRAKRHEDQESDGQCDVTSSVTVTHQNRTETEQNRTETEPPKPPLGASGPKYNQAFLDFWEISTKRGSKFDAHKAWLKLNPDFKLCGEIINGHITWKHSEQWQDETKQPHISTWLNRRGWEEIVPKRSSNVTKNDRTAEAARRLLSRINSQDRSVGERGVRRGDFSSLSGTAEALIGGTDPDSDRPHD